MEISSKKITESQPSIMVLNDDCLSTVFRYLGWNDLMNAAETCVRFNNQADAVSKTRFLEWTVDENIIERSHWKKRFFSYIGPRVVSLEVDFTNCKDVTKFLQDIQNKCTALKTLTLKHMKVERKQVCFNICVEKLVLDGCDLYNAKWFLDNFPNLKCLYILDVYGLLSLESFILQYNLEKEDFALACRTFEWDANNPSLVFQRNLGIEDFALSCRTFQRDTNHFIFGLLDNLIKLKLNCFGEDVNSCLMELLQKDTLEELELIHIAVNGETYDILNSFKKLRLLNIQPLSVKRNFDKLAQLALPNLKHLRLGSFEFSFSQFISSIKEFHSIENIDLFQCNKLKQLPLSEEKIIQEIIVALERSGRRSTLTMTLPEYYPTERNITKKYAYESSLLRIANNYYVEKFGSIHKVFYESI